MTTALLLLLLLYIGDNNQLHECLFHYFNSCKTEQDREYYLNSIINNDFKNIIVELHALYIKYPFYNDVFAEAAEDNSFIIITGEYATNMAQDYNLSSPLDFITFYQKSFYKNIISEGDASEAYKQIINSGNTSFMLMATDDEDIAELLFLDNHLTDVIANKEKSELNSHNPEDYIDKLSLKRHLLAYNIFLKNKL